MGNDPQLTQDINLGLTADPSVNAAAIGVDGFSEQWTDERAGANTARAAANVLQEPTYWNNDSLTAMVEHGLISLTGEGDSDDQHYSAVEPS